MTHNPVYNLRKLEDCVRLIRSTKPMKQFAEAMFACIERVPGAPSRQEIIDEMKRQNAQEKEEQQRIEEWKGQNL